MLKASWKKIISWTLLCAILVPVIVPTGASSVHAADGVYGNQGLALIAAGGQFSIGIQPHGVVTGWGDNNNGQITVPPDATNIKSLTAGRHHVVALKADGTVMAWGNNDQGQSNVPEDLTGVKSIAAGNSFSLALKDDGTVDAWGSNNEGQIVVPVGLTGVKAIAAGDAHALALRADGSVVAWGDDSDEQATVPSGLNDVISVAAGNNFSLALKVDGTVTAWGDNGHGQVAFASGLTDVIAIAAGDNYAAALKYNGTVVAWGDDSHGQVAFANGLTAVTAIAAGDGHLVAMKADGTIVAGGDNSEEQLNVPSDFSSTIKVRHGAQGPGLSLVSRSDGVIDGWGFLMGEMRVPAGLADVTQLSVGDSFAVAIQSDGTLSLWGDPAYDRLNIPGGLTSAKAISAGDYHSLAIRPNGGVAAWGYNNAFQSNVPAGLSGIAVSAGGSHSLALRADGIVEAWGNDDSWRSTVPSDLTDVIAISAGNNHSLALKADGTVVAWGDNSNFHINVPPGLTNVTAIFAGTNASYALRSDGTVAMWGNGGGLTPSFIADLSDIVSLSIRGNSLLAIKPDGSVVSDQTVPGSDLLNSITLQEGAFTEVFNRLDTSYTYYYDGHSLDSVHLAAVLLHPAHADLYVNDLQVLDGSEIEIDLTGATSDTVVPVRVEPYYKPAQTYTVTLSIDSEGPVALFNGNGSSTPATSAEPEVTVSDALSGVDEATLEFAWTQSVALPTSGWDVFDNGDTLPINSGDGNWYLHVRGADRVGNTFHAVSEPFLLDNTVEVPVITAITTNPTSLSSAGGSATITLTGAHLTGQSIDVYVNGVNTAAAVVGSATSAEATITLPANNTYSAVTHTITAYLGGAEVAALSAAITVNPLPTPSTPFLSGDVDLTRLEVYEPDGPDGKQLELSPAFSPKKLTYTLETVEEAIELRLAPSHSLASVKLKGERLDGSASVPLAMGDNVVTITVQAENGSVQTYTLTIHRAAPPESVPACKFTDLRNHWAQSDVCEAAELGIVEGVSSNRFEPNRQVTRVEFASMLMRALGIGQREETNPLTFGDTNLIPEWAMQETRTAVAVGILEGYSDGLLRPNKTVNRAEMAAMIARAMNWDTGTTLPGFSDEPAIPAWAKTYVEAVRQHGVLAGRTGNTFVPNGITTRAEAAVALLRLWKLHG